uniref:Tetraspanin Pls1 family n=1 Tax=Mycena chlorophos TaxID=658473 RepID=A0ABQ0LZY0_MYCCL|nr:predicted protein [Mycena chlorophos]
MSPLGCLLTWIEFYEASGLRGLFCKQEGRGSLEVRQAYGLHPLPSRKGNNDASQTVLLSKDTAPLREQFQRLRKARKREEKFVDILKHSETEFPATDQPPSDSCCLRERKTLNVPLFTLFSRGQPCKHLLSERSLIPTGVDKRISLSSSSFSAETAIMVSKGLMGFWGFVDFLLLGAGGMSIALSIVWREPSVLMNLTLDNQFLTAGMVVGIALVATFLVSLGAVVQKNHVTGGFVILNYILVADAIIVLVVGSMIWFFSLRQRSEFHTRWIALPDATKQQLQDQFSCCGYFNATDNIVIGGYCQSQQFADNLNVNNTDNFCVTPVTKFTDYTLENVFTTIYGYMSIVLTLLVTSLCVIKKREEHERFKKIDAKRGRSFV